MKDFLRLVHVEEAIGKIMAALPRGERHAEELELRDAMGRVTAEDIFAPEDLPGFTRSSMDGFAVRADDTHGASEGLPAYLTVVGEVLMGRPGDLSVADGQAVRISTGGVLPDGADAVVMVEETELSGNTLEVVKGVARGENIVRHDEDVARGSLLFGKGTALGPARIGALAGLGIQELSVFTRPVVGIISTGDEVVPANHKPGPGQVRDINTAALAASVIEEGCLPRPFGVVADDLERLLGASRDALGSCDALLISGGSSVGVRDVTVDVLAELGEPGILAHGLYLRPGKPTLLAVCGGKLVAGLPGNPASALAVFREVLSPILAMLRGEVRGWPGQVPRVVRAVLDRSVPSATGRLELVPVALRTTNEGLVASPVMGKSNLIGTLAAASGNVRIPEGSEGIEKGQAVDVELLY